MKFVPIGEVEKEEPSYSFVPLDQENEGGGYSFTPLESEPEEKITGVKEKTKKGESVLAGTTLSEGAEPTKPETFKLPGFEHLYPSEESPFNLSEQARTEKLIKQGIAPETARATAQRNIAEGKPTTGREFGIARETPEEVQLAEDLKYQTGKTGIEDTAQVLKRSGVKAVTGLAQAGGGMQRFVGEMLDLDTSDTTKTLDQINSFTQSMGEAPDKPVQIIEGAFNSIGQQLPALVGGVVTGSEPLVLASMFANSFGQTYDESRRKDLDALDSTARAAAYAAFEVIGEKFGLGDRLSALKKLANGVDEKDLAAFFAKSLAKEIPGEELTYAGQFAVDKGFDLNPEAGLKKFIQGAIDTMLVTATQGGIMLGAGTTMNKLAGAKGAPREKEPEIKTAAELAKEKGFTFVPLGQTKEEVLATETKTAEPTPGIFERLEAQYNSNLDNLKQQWAVVTGKATPTATAEGAPETDARQKFYEQTQARYQQLGLTREEAKKLADQDFEEAGYGTRLDTGAVQSGVSVPSEQPAATAGTPAAVGAGVGRDSQAAVLPASGAEAQPSALTPETKKWFGKSKAVDKQGKPLVLYRGLVGGEVDPFTGRAGYAVFTSDNPYIASSYSGDPAYEFGVSEGVVYPMYAKVDDVVEFPGGDAFDKFEFDKKAKTLKPGQALVARDVMDTGPRMTTEMAKGYEKKSGDVWAFANGTEFKSAIQGAPTTTAPAVAEVTPIAPVKQGKPRGRPKAALTEEEAAAKRAAKAAQTKEWKATNKQLVQAQQVLDLEPPVREDFQDQDSYLDAGMRYRTERQAALDLLNGMATGARRNTALGKRAQEGLAHPSITPQELAAIKEREAIRKGTARSELLEHTNSTENAEYNKFKTAANALSWIMKNGNEFESTLARRLMPFIRNMRVVIVNTPADLPSNYLRKQFAGAAGMYSNGVIYLDANGGLNNTVFLHEALHGATIDRINKYLDDIAAGVEPDAKLAEAVEELNAVMKSAGRMYDALSALGMTDARVDALARAEAFTDIKEFVAYGMSHPAMQEFLLQAPGMYAGTKTSFVDKLFTPFVQAIRNMFNMGEKHNSAMQDLILVTDKLLSAQFAQPKVTREEAALAKKQSKKIDKDTNALMQSKSSTETEKLLGNMIAEHGFDGVKDLLNARWDALGDGFISKLLYQMPTSDIIRWKGDAIPALASADTMMQEMAAMRMRLMSAVAKKAEALAKFISKNGSTELSDAMHLARLKKVSPTKYETADEYIQNDPLVQKYDQLIADPATDPASLPAYEGQRTQRINQINAVYAKWEALGKQKGGHDMYKMVQEYYQDMYNLNRKLLDDQINKLPIDAAAKAKLMKSIRLMHEQGVSNKQGETETVTLEDGTESIPVTFASLPEDYFPFLRRGKYWLNVDGPHGREFYLFESGNDRNNFMAKRGREIGIDARTDTTGVFKKGDDIHALRSNFQGESQMLQEMFKAIDEADTTKAPADFSEDLKDQLYQIYLMTMPERSFRKQFLHAEKITGFSADILRNLKDSGTKYSNQLAKLKYGVDLRNEIQRGRDTLEGMPANQRSRLELFVNEMASRADMEINPTEDHWLITKANQISYLMLLTSAATAGVQMLSVPNMVMPTLNVEYGYGKSAAMFTKYMQLWKSVGVTNKDPDTGEVTFTAPSFTSSELARNNPELSRAFQYAIEHYNTFSLTNVSVLTGAAKTPTTVGESALVRGGQNVYKIITALLNGSERMSREIAFGMTFELEYAKTGDFEGSVQKAVSTTQELLGRYDSAQRPRSWRGPIGKTIGQFKMYAAFMTSWFLRNGQTMIKEGMLESEGRAAAQKLTGVILMGALFHGLVGSPLYSMICNLIDAWDWLFGDEEEMRKRKAKNPLTAYDSDMRFRYEFLRKYFGETKIPGLDGRDHSLDTVLEKGPVSALTDINIGSRTSYDGMWFRDWKQGATTNETLLNFAAANFGPAISVGGNFVKAFDDFGNGKIQRGVEKIAPAFFKAPAVALRASKEGYKSQAGDMLLRKSEVSEANIIAQALGFQPTRLNRIQEMAFKYGEEDKKAQSDKEGLLKRLNEAVNTGEPPEKFKSIFKDIAKHNRRYPHEAYEIDDDIIEKSIESYAGRKELTVRGLYIPEKKEDILFPGVRATRPLK